MEVGADRVVVAAGGRPVVPPVVVLGGGYIAAEPAHVCHSAGSHVTVVGQQDRLLGQQDALVPDAMRVPWDLCLGRELTGVSGEPGKLLPTLDHGAEPRAVTGRCSWPFRGSQQVGVLGDPLLPGCCTATLPSFGNAARAPASGLRGTAQRHVLAELTRTP